MQIVPTLIKIGAGLAGMAVGAAVTRFTEAELLRTRDEITDAFDVTIEDGEVDVHIDTDPETETEDN